MRRIRRVSIRATAGLPMPRLSTLLILSNDAVAAALLGMLAELATYSPAFAEPGERPEDALARVRPALVVLVDGALDAAASDLFFARAAKRKVGIAIFGRATDRVAAAAQAQSRGVHWLDVPTDLERFTEIVRAAATTEWWKGGGDRRRGDASLTAGLEPQTDGTVVFRDDGGRRWHVYDRRGGERRDAGRFADERSTVPDERLFVSDDGEVRRCSLQQGESGVPSAALLEQQLRRATRA